MSDHTNTPRKSKRRRIIAGVIIIVLSVLALGGPQWAKWPKRTANECASHISAGRFDEGNGMLAYPSSIKTNDDDSVTVTTTDGATINLAKNELPLQQPSSLGDDNIVVEVGVEP